MKGAFAFRPLGLQLLILVGLVLLGSLLGSFLGLTVAMIRTNLPIEELLSLINAFDQAQSATVFKTVQGFATLGTFLFPALVGAYFFSTQPAPFLGTDRFSAWPWLVIPLLLVLGYSAGSMSDLLYRLSEQLPWPTWLSDVQDYLVSNQEAMLARYSQLLDMPSFYSFIEVMLVMALLPALCEEALFRGLIQPLLARRVATPLAVVFTAFLFALLHQQFLAFLSIFALGIILGYLRHWSGSLWVPSLVHFINNGIIVASVYFTDAQYKDVAEGQAPALSVSLAWILALAACLGILYWLWQERPGRPQ
ncbi:MAG: CPBP family intramembrane glutamic endopeptidase [Schleiferiaceae bacterium]|nr:CPBP family intramembrane glutamic endopeptidase [Schleiferiaceae bacterium]